MANIHTLLMIRPNSFGFNSQTKFTNSFQNESKEDKLIIHEKALSEFDDMVNTIKSKDIEIKVFNDIYTDLPDTVFLNNWLAVLPDGKLIVFPLMSENRRKERRQDIIDDLIENYNITELIDLTHYEKDNLFLESTGSVVFDHENKLAFASISKRTSEQVFQALCDKIGYKGYVFHAYDLKGGLIYHTNVMMSICSNYLVICLDSIEDSIERAFITEVLKKTKRKIIKISISQMSQYAGNCFEVFNKKGESKFIISRTAYSSLDEDQIYKISKYSEIVPVNVSIIERIGGGSARCMITGICS